MRTNVEFRSGAFPPHPGEEESTNPGRWGKGVAQYLRAELSARGFPGGEPRPEDWGWVVPIDNAEFDLWVGCGNYEEYPDGFLCFIEPSKPFVRRLLRKISTVDRIEALAAALDDALRSHSAVRDVRWWTAADAGT